MQELSLVFQVDTWLINLTSAYPPTPKLIAKASMAVRAVHVYTSGQGALGLATIRRYIKPNRDICRALSVDLQPPGTEAGPLMRLQSRLKIYLCKSYTSCKYVGFYSSDLNVWITSNGSSIS
jgi:hypothetical protein